MENSTSDQSPAQSSTMPLSELVTWCIAFALVALAIVIGNTLTIVVFTRKKLLRMRANYFLITLAVADLLVGAFPVPMYIHQLVWYWKTRTNNTGTFFSFMAIDIFTGFASIFGLTIIALERLYAVMWPLKHRVTSKQTYAVLISVVWILSAVVAILYLVYGFQVVKFKVFFYLVIFFIFSSLLVICVAYVLIWVKVTIHQNDNPRLRRTKTCQRHYSKASASTENQKRSRQDKELLKTLLILTLVFVLTWIPFYILNIVVFFIDDHEGSSSLIPIQVFCFTKLLHYANSFANPVVYSIRIPRFARTVLGFVRRKKQAFARSIRALSEYI